MPIGTRTRTSDKKGKKGGSADTLQLTISLQRELLLEFEEAADYLNVTPQQLLKYMILTSLRYQKPPEQTLPQWVRGK